MSVPVLPTTLGATGLLCSVCFVGILSFIEIDSGRGTKELKLDLASAKEIQLVFSKLKDKCVKFTLNNPRENRLSTVKWWEKIEKDKKCNWMEDSKTKGKDLSREEIEIVKDVCHNSEWKKLSSFAEIKESDRPIVWYTLCLYLAREFEGRTEN